MRHSSNPQVTVYSHNITTNAKELIANSDGFISAEPVSQPKYFDTKPGFDPLSLLKSPMGIMVGMTVLLLFCMKNMPDTEELKKEQATLKKRANQQPVEK